jgi:hypothetical protein
MSPGFTYYWCEECGWDSVRSRDNIRGPCPECAGDTGRDGDMRSKPCPPDQGPVEGRDDRKEPT